LEKWEWRIRTGKKKVFGVKVLSSKYGETNGIVNRDGRQRSAWWSDIKNIERGVCGFKSNWFSEKLRRNIGDGKNRSFWIDPWIYGGSLKNMYPGLFVFLENKEISLKEVMQGEVARRQGSFRWRRSLMEKKLELEIIERLQRIHYKEEEDMWV
jgi:hypothetical protein